MPKKPRFYCRRFFTVFFLIIVFLVLNALFESCNSTHTQNYGETFVLAVYNGSAAEAKYGVSPNVTSGFNDFGIYVSKPISLQQGETATINIISDVPIVNVSKGIRGGNLVCMIFEGIMTSVNSPLQSIDDNLKQSGNSLVFSANLTASKTDVYQVALMNQTGSPHTVQLSVLRK